MKRAIRVLTITIVIGTSFGLYFYFNGVYRNPLDIFTSILSNVCIGSLMMLFIYQRQVILERIGPEWAKLLLMMFLLVGAAIWGTQLTYFIRDVFLFRREFHLFTDVNIYLLNIIIVFVTGIPIYQHEVWKEYAYAKIEAQRFELLKRQQLQTLAELEMLRAKVNPHFLYNVHNTIAGLIYTQPDKAEKMVLLLSRFFRFALNKNQNTFNTVQEEVEIVQTYLQLQQIRFGTRLQTCLHIAPDCEKEKLPSFILQPIVENAVKYSIEQVPGLGKVQVKVFRDSSWLVIKVGDASPAFPDPLTYGFGLQSILNKLNLLYPGKYTFALQNNPEKNVQIKLYCGA
ncbi:MAG: histidine kinase [Bacteroidota bacterium]|nr:histidine kinase [Bacteroidota bacterium]